MQVWPGHRYPLGATYDGTGTNFAIFSEVAEAVELCLFDPSATSARSSCTSRTRSSGTPTCPASSPASGTATGCYGPYDPDRGLRCNPHKLLLDPYARAIDGDIDWHPSLYALRLRQPGRDVRPRLGAVHAQGRGGQPVLRLGQRPAARTSRTTTR